MCFSAQASFATSAILLLIGLRSIIQVKSSRQIMLASIPLLFSIQQLCEGILWLTLSRNTLPFLSIMMTYSFLFFALIIWPVWIPCALSMIEKNEFSRKILSIFTIIGSIISCYFLYSLIMQGSSAQIIGNHIFYNYYVSFFHIKRGTMALFYCIPVIGSFFIASMPLLKFSGIALLVSVLITIIFWKFYFTSVWCFFAAVLSILTIIALKQMNMRSDT
ncbi:MAG TPA: hypothetical protein ENI08_00990 [Candidatus Dependentiae bacterium]|nr:hypothetical protein [Candidatus Dependentiae bacterium]